MPMFTKSCKFVTFGVELRSIKSEDPLTRWSWKVVWQIDCYVFTSTMTMATKLGRVVLYTEEILCVKSQNLLIMWFCKVTWYISTATRRLTLNLASCELRRLSPIKSDSPLKMWSFELTWQIEIVLSPLPLCLKPPKIVAWRPRGEVPNHKVTWPFKQMVWR